jgi:ubiquitin-conjugating enzyme E2 variant
MEKGAIIHEPLVPRTFRLLAESEKEGNGLVTYGLKDPNDNSFTFWNGSILLDDGRFYELQLECDQNYPQKPPKVKFLTKINIPFVDNSGWIKSGSLNILKNWNRDCTLESYLMEIRNELKNNLGKYKQPPEGSRY